MRFFPVLTLFSLTVVGLLSGCGVKGDPVPYVSLERKPNQAAETSPPPSDAPTSPQVKP